VDGRRGQGARVLKPATSQHRARSGAGDLLAAYRRWRRSSLGSLTDEVELRLLLEAAGDVTGRRVLDVGCGDGAHLRVLAGRGAAAVGVDRSSEALAQARETLRPPPPRLVRGDAGRLPFDAGAFDLVWAVTVLCFVADPEQVLREMARVVRPGGRVVLGELGARSAWAAARRVKGWLGSPRWRAARFWTDRELRRLAADAGLRVDDVRGGVYYPPSGVLARALHPLDRALGRASTLGAAFLVLGAEKGAMS